MLSSQRRETLQGQFERLRAKLFPSAKTPRPIKIKTGSVKIDLERRQMFIRAESARDSIR